MSPKAWRTELANCKASGADITSVQPSQTITLSDETTLADVLEQSGCVGHLSIGRIERAGPDQLKVYDSYGELFEYVSGDRLRSWAYWDLMNSPSTDGAKSALKTLRGSAHIYLNRED